MAKSPQHAKPKTTELELHERDLRAAHARTAVIAEFRGDANLLAGEILRLRMAMGQAAQALTLAQQGRELVLVRCKPVEPPVNQVSAASASGL